MPAGIAATLDGLAAIVGPRATTARGVLDQHGGSEAYHAHRPPDVVVFPETTQDVAQIVEFWTRMRAIKAARDPDGLMNPGRIFHPASDLRA